MPSLAKLEALVREHAAVTTQLAPLQERADGLQREIDEEKRALQRDGILEEGPEEIAEVLPAATPEMVVALLTEYAGLEWKMKEIEEFMDVEPESVSPVVRQLVDSGQILLRKGKFLIDDE